MPNHSSKPKRPRDVNQLAKLVVDLATGEPRPEPITEPPETPKPPERVKDPAAVALGRKGGLKGGKARAEKLTAEERSEIGRRAAAKRWSKDS